MTNLGALTCYCYVLNVIFCELTSEQYLALSHLIHKVNTHFFLQSVECLQLLVFAIKNRTSASEVVMGTQLIKHFESIISFSFFYYYLASLEMKVRTAVLLFSGF